MRLILTTAALVLSAVAWLFLPPNVRPNPTWFYWGSVFAGALFVLGASARRSMCHRRWWMAIPAVALVGFVVLWARPDGIGPAFLGVGLLMMTLMPDNPWLNRLGRGMATAGAVLTLQLAGQYLYFVEFGPRGQNPDLFAPLITEILRFTGLDAGLSSEGVRLISYDAIMELVPNWVNLGVHPFSQLMLGILMLVAIRRLKWRSLLYGLGVIYIFAIARFCFLLVFNPIDHNFDMLWNPWDVALSVLLIIPFLRFALKPTDIHLSEGPISTDVHGVTKFGRTEVLKIGIAAFVVVLAWSFAVGYYESGTKKQGRMMIDEYHSDWEWSDMPFDTVWYGQQSTYNFYSGAEWYGYHYEMTRGNKPFTRSYLDSFDIIMLKTPTETYTDDEVEAVLDWLDDGGGLILIGDHTNVFGSATVLNQIGGKVGIRFVPDIMYDLETGDLNLYDAPPFMPHPVTQHIRRFLWGGPCTLECDWPVRGAMISHRSKTLPADYSGRNFFPERTQQNDYRYGVFFNVACVTYGKGRVIAFTDSTLISNFFVFIPGKPELWLGMSDWTNRMNRFNGWRWVMLFVILAGLVYLGIQTRRTRLAGLSVAATVGLWTFVGSVAVVEALNMKHYPIPKPIREFTQLNFEEEHSRFFVPELRLANNQDKDWHTFFVWTQRVGVVPRIWPTVEDAVKQGDNMVIIEPAQEFTDEECTELKGFVEGGGCLVVLDDEINKAKTSDKLLATFGVTIDYNKKAAPQVGQKKITVEGYNEVVWVGGSHIRGADPILTVPITVPEPDSIVVWAQKQVGAGRLIVFSNSHVFERRVMGYTSMLPNATQNAVSQLTYKLMDMLNRHDPETVASEAGTEEKREDNGI